VKVRNGFVSNSSSSSFIVALYWVPKTESELKAALDVKCPEVVTAGIWADSEFSVKVTEKEITELATFGEPTLERFDPPERPRALDTAVWDDYFNRRKEYGARVARNFVSRNPGKVFLHFRSPKNDGAAFRALGASMQPVDRPCIEIVEH